MAKGKKCPQCGTYMYAISEKHHPAVNEIVYQCRNSNCNFEERVFEDK